MLDLEIYIKKLKTTFIFDTMTNVGSFLFVMRETEMEDPATGDKRTVAAIQHARVVAIEPDQKKDWWIYTVVFPESPEGPQRVKWQLRQEQACGLETFTMGGRSMWVAPFMDIITAEPEERVKKEPGKLIPLFGDKNENHNP